MRAKLIFEFERGASPRKALGLGKEHIQEIIEDYKTEGDFEYNITDDLKVTLDTTYYYP